MSSRRSIILLLIALSLVLTACGGGNQPSSVTWRNVTLQMPDGWYVFEEEETRLSISNADIGPEAMRGADPDDDEAELPNDVVAMFFTFEAQASPAAWRAYAEQQDATVESDEQILVGEDVPATRIVMNYVTDDVPRIPRRSELSCRLAGPSSCSSSRSRWSSRLVAVATSRRP